MHIWSLSQCLLQRGHKVIVITHAYGDRSGIRHMTNGLKVYYLPLTVIYDQVILPTLCSFLPLFRNILIRERISIVHGHQSTSVLANECIMYARTMGMKALLTDHSLFGFADIESININKLLEITLSDIDHVICVSNTCRENLALRASLHPFIVSTIPNAVDASKFTPDPSRRYPTNTINIVLLSRLVYRKGIDLLVKIIPIICAKFPIIHFIIGGDGPKKLILEEMRERYQLHDRVEFLGAVPHHSVRDVLVRGHVFLNCSLTESFCIALLEAASCGLFVVSTRVGGVPEVLPPSMIKFAEPTVTDLVDALSEAVSISRRIVPYEMHERVKTMYNWVDVSRRTEAVYDEITLAAVPSLAERFMKYYTVGFISGICACFLVAMLHLYLKVCEYLWPSEDIERCLDLPWVQDAYYANSHASNLLVSTSGVTSTLTPAERLFRPTSTTFNSSHFMNTNNMLIHDNTNNRNKNRLTSVENLSINTNVSHTKVNGNTRRVKSPTFQ